MPLTKEQLIQYTQDLARERGFDATKTAQLVALVDGDSDVTISRQQLRELIEPIVEHPLARHATFSQQLDLYKKKREELEQWRNNTAEPLLAKHKAELEQAQRVVAAFEAKFGKLEDVQDIGGGKGVTSTGEVVDMKKVEEVAAKVIQQDRQDFVQFELERDEIQRSHFSMFKELPNVSELLQHIGSAAQTGKALSLRDAYEELYGPRVKEYQAKVENEKLESEVNKRVAERERLRRTSAPRDGAALGEGAEGPFWGRTEAKEGDGKSAATPSDVDLEIAFQRDMQEQLIKNNAVTP